MAPSILPDSILPLSMAPSILPDSILPLSMAPSILPDSILPSSPGLQPGRDEARASNEAESARRQINERMGIS